MHMGSLGASALAPAAQKRCLCVSRHDFCKWLGVHCIQIVSAPPVHEQGLCVSSQSSDFNMSLHQLCPSVCSTAAGPVGLDMSAKCSSQGKEQREGLWGDGMGTAWPLLQI